MSHEDALVFAHQSSLDITFRMTRPLTDFMATLHKNGTEEKKLSKYVVILTKKKLINLLFFSWKGISFCIFCRYVSHRIQGDFVTLTVSFPDEGQYGMDIYTREVSGNSNGNGISGGSGDHENEKHLLTHCCKYLINFTAPRRWSLKTSI